MLLRNTSTAELPGIDTTAPLPSIAKKYRRMNPDRTIQKKKHTPNYEVNKKPIVRESSEKE